MPYILPLGDSTREQKISTWAVYGTLSLLSAVLCGMALVALVSSKKLLKQPFMRLAFFLLVPDFLNGFFCMQCYMHLIGILPMNATMGIQPTGANGTFAPEFEYGSWSLAGDVSSRNWSCDFQAVYFDWLYTLSMWMGVLIAYHLRRMLVSASRGKAFEYSVKRSICESLSMYTAAAVLTAINYNNGNLLTVNFRGYFCTMVAPFPENQWYVNWIVYVFTLYVPSFLLVAIFVEVFVVRKIHTSIAGKDKHASMKLVKFFMKLLLVYIFLWVPTFVVKTSGYIQVNLPMACVIMISFNHIAGIVSGIIYLGEPEIRNSFKRTCCGAKIDDDANKISSSSSTAGQTALVSSKDVDDSSASTSSSSGTAATTASSSSSSTGTASV